MADEEKAKKYLRRLKHLEEIRQETDAHCKEISEYILPRRGKFMALGQTPIQGEKKRSKIIDNTAGRAMRVLKAGMQGGLTSPSRPWFRLGTEDADLTEFGPVKDWLFDVERKMYAVFRRSNFYQSTHSLYGEEAGFGTACLYEEEDIENAVRFRLITMGEYAIAQNAGGVVDTCYRRYFMTARQMVERFGRDNVSNSVQQSVEKTESEDTRFQVVHAVQPRNERDINGADRLNMPWESVYIEYENPQDVLEMGGYQEFPFFCPRWEVAGSDDYGRGPGMDILPDVKMLQELQATSLTALHKTADPPLNVPSTMKDRLNRFPGGINFYDSTNPDGIKPLYEVKFDTASVDAKIERVQNAVEQGLFNDVFLMIATMPGYQPRTATEIMERHEEKLIMLGPVIERNIHELLDPCINRTFKILYRMGLIPIPPEELQDQELKVEYISLLAQAQKFASAHSVQATVSFGLSLAEAKPEILDKIDFREAIEEYADVVGAPAGVIRSDDEADILAQARAEEQRKQEQMERMTQATETAKTMSETDTSGENVLTEIAKTMEGE